MRLTSISLAIVAGFLALSGAAQAQTPPTEQRIVTKQEFWGTLIVPSSRGYGSTFTSPLPYGLTSNDYFYENFSFIVPDASYSSFTASLNAEPFLGITGLQARLYQGEPVIGSPGTPYSSTFPVPWTGPVATGSGPFNLIQSTDLGAGTWTLQIRGKVTGVSGGSYAGVVNVTPIPEPSTYALLALGLVAIGLSVRRRLPSN